MKFARNLAAAALAASTVLAFNAPAISAPLMQDKGVSSSAIANGIETVQWRGRGGGFRGNRGFRGNQGFRGGPRYGYRGGYYRGGRGYGIGPAIGGLAVGAIIGGAIASSQAQAAGNAVAYCSQRFRSYDPGSGTYLGFDGLRHACP